MPNQPVQLYQGKSYCIINAPKPKVYGKRVCDLCAGARICSRRPTVVLSSVKLCCSQLLVLNEVFQWRLCTLCVCVCACVCACACVCVCVHACLRVCMSLHVCGCVHVFESPAVTSPSVLIKYSLDSCL